jgi:hypothetical protein
LNNGDDDLVPAAAGHLAYGAHHTSNLGHVPALFWNRVSILTVPWSEDSSEKIRFNAFAGAPAISPNFTLLRLKAL